VKGEKGFERSVFLRSVGLKSSSDSIVTAVYRPPTKFSRTKVGAPNRGRSNILSLVGLSAGFSSVANLKTARAPECADCQRLRAPEKNAK